MKRALLAMSLCGCSALQTQIIENDVTSCTTTQVSMAAPTALANIVAALTSPSPGAWSPLLDTALENAGGDGLCILADVVKQIENGALPVSYDPLFAPATLSLQPGYNQLAIIRGEQYLNGWHLKGSRLAHHQITR